MMPPKKSQAARAEGAKTTPEADHNTAANGEEEDEGEKQQQDAEAKEEVNIFKTEVVDGKRVRSGASGAVPLDAWLDHHLEKKDDVLLVMGDVYAVYLETCISSNTFAVEQVHFTRKVKDKFGKSFAIREDSPYFDAVQPKKVRKIDAKPRPKADSLKLKMKDIVNEILTVLNNPTNGIRFFKLKTAISAKYPALQLDTHPNRLKKELEKGVHFGYLELVKGIGLTGFYRLPGDATGASKDKGKKEEAKDGEESGEGDEKVDDKADTEDEKSEDKDGDTEGDTEEEDVKDKEDEGETEDDKTDKKEAETEAKKEGGADEKKKQKKKRKKVARRPDWLQASDKLIHSDPQRVEDTFFMAMTYMAEPKEASVARIKKYLSTHYSKDPTSERFSSLMATGVEKGFWEQVSGSGGNSGSYRLTLTEFDPTDDHDLQGMVINAIMASHEPKVCSVNLLKRYVLEFHPKFNLAERPFMMKCALERAINKNMIKRLSGIGLSGSFQLVKQFIPSPKILAGIDSASDDEDDDDASGDRSDDSEKVEVEYAQGFKLSQFQDAYKPRPSQRRGKARTAAAGSSDKPLTTSTGRALTVRAAVRKPAPKPAQKKTVKRRLASVESESDDSESEEEVVPQKRRAPPKAKAKPKAASKKKPAARPKPAPKPKQEEEKDEVEEEVEEEEEEEEEEILPKKVRKTAGSRPMKRTATSSSRPTRSPAKRYREDSEQESDDDDKIEVKPPTPKSTPKKQNKSSSSAKQLQVATVAARGRKGPPPKSRMTPSSEEEDSSSEEEEVEEAYTATPSRSRGGQTKTSPAPKTSPKPTPKKGSAKKGGRGGRKK